MALPSADLLPPGRRGPLPAWPQADLLRRVQQAIDIAHRTLQSALAQGEVAAPPAHRRPGEARPLVLDKVVGEAAMLGCCAFLANPGDAALRTAIEALARQLAPHARGERVQARLCSDPAGAIGHASAHVFLSRIGCGDARFDRFLDEIIASHRVGGAERLPNQRLEWHWLEAMRTTTARASIGHGGLLAQTCAGQALDVLGSSTIDLYLYTHVVLYASDMGQRDAAWPRDTRLVSAEADAALAAALDADNYDLAAELLWTWPMLALPWSATAQFGFELLAALQDEQGFLPGPEFAAARAQARPGSVQDDLVLRTSYHATLVMGLLCATALRPGRAPVFRPPALQGALSGAAVAPDPLLDELTERSVPPRWRGLHATFGGADRAALSPLLINVALRRAAAGADLGRVRAILEAVVGNETWSELPAVQQAASLLQRCSALARLRSVSALAPAA